MSQDRSVTSAFVRVLVVEFVERRQPWISLDAANDRTVAMVRSLPRLANVQVPSVSALAQRLAEMHAEAFAWDGSRLLLTDTAASDRVAVFEALRRFLAALDGEVPPAMSEATKQSPTSPAPDESKVLDDFFDGYEKEIMKARLGQNTEPDRG